MTSFFFCVCVAPIASSFSSFFFPPPQRSFVCQDFWKFGTIFSCRVPDRNSGPSFTPNAKFYAGITVCPFSLNLHCWRFSTLSLLIREAFLLPVPVTNGLFSHMYFPPAQRSRTLPRMNGGGFFPPSKPSKRMTKIITFLFFFFHLRRFLFFDKPMYSAVFLLSHARAGVRGPFFFFFFLPLLISGRRPDQVFLLLPFPRLYDLMTCQTKLSPF